MNFDGLSGRTLIIFGFIIIAGLFLMYGRYQDPGQFVPDSFDPLQRIAVGFYVIFISAFGLIGFGMYKFHKNQLGKSGTLAKIAILTWNTRSRKIFLVTMILYGICFSLLSGTLVYQPDVTFSYHYGVMVPSVQLVPCCDSIGYMPLILVYLTEHVGLQIIPINFLLQVIVSYLVGLNVSISANAISISRKKRSVSGIGVATGLFIACPTCAGSVLSLFLGPLVGITASVFLVQLQTLFIAVSIPLLAYAPFFITKHMFDLDDKCQI